MITFLVNNEDEDRGVDRVTNSRTWVTPEFKDMGYTVLPLGPLRAAEQPLTPVMGDAPPAC